LLKKQKAFRRLDAFCLKGGYRVHFNATDEVNHYLTDFILDKASQIAIK